MISSILVLILMAATPASPAVAKPEAPAAAIDSPEEIAADSARDLKDNRFYNKPGATRADYDRDWQECRLIARGSRTPGGSPVVVYNPAVISPAAAAGGGILGALIAQAIVEGQVRRANRRSCLMIRNWRLVEVEDAEAARLAALPDAERDAWFNIIVGAAEPKGQVTTFANGLADPEFLKEKSR